MEFRSRERLLVVVAAVCVGVFLADRIVISPLISLWKSRSDRIEELQQQLETGQTLIGHEQAWNERWEKMKKRSLPTDVSDAENLVLQSLDSWSRRSGLSHVSVKPRWIEEKREPVRKFECRVTAEGNMAALMRFIYELESDPLALRTEEIEIASRDEAGRSLDLRVQFTGLVLKGDAP